MSYFFAIYVSRNFREILAYPFLSQWGYITIDVVKDTYNLCPKWKKKRVTIHHHHHHPHLTVGMGCLRIVVEILLPLEKLLWALWGWGCGTQANLTQGEKVKVAQVCLTLWDPMDYTVHRNLQARILESVAYPFSMESSWPRNHTGIFCIAGGFFTNWAIREALREGTS